MYIHPAPSAAPTSVNVSAMNCTAITVQWGMVPCIEQNGHITGYTLNVTGIEDMKRVEDFFGGGVTQVIISELTPSTTYSIQIAAVNSEGTGPYSAPITIDTPNSELVYHFD